jgi:hypothetical protein
MQDTYIEEIVSNWATEIPAKQGTTWLIAVYHLPFLGKLNRGDSIG